MKHLLTDRRLFISLIGIITLALLALRAESTGLTEFVWGIVAIVGAVASSNAWQAVKSYRPFSAQQQAQDDSIIDNPDAEVENAKPRRKK